MTGRTFGKAQRVWANFGHSQLAGKNGITMKLTPSMKQPPKAESLSIICINFVFFGNVCTVLLGAPAQITMAYAIVSSAFVCLAAGAVALRVVLRNPTS